MLLSGDFLQIATFGKSICASLHTTITTDDSNCRKLISEFKVFHIEEQVRSKYELRKRCLKQFRALPKIFSSEAKWTVEDKKN